MTEERNYIEVIGGKVWCNFLGKEKRETPLLIIHGGPGASHLYLKPLEKLVANRPIIFYDQLGCGNSDKPKGNDLWRVERFVDEINKIIDYLKLENLHLLGQSWGAALAVEYLFKNNAAKVKSLILSGPLLNSERWVKDQLSYIDLLPNNLKYDILNSEKKKDFENTAYQNAMIEFYKRHLCRLEVWPDCLNETFSKINFEQYLYMWGPSEFTVNGTLRNFSLINKLKNVTLPTLFTCGEYDEAKPDTVQDFAKHIKNSKVHIFKNASHEHHLESENEYLEIVEKFLSENDKLFI